MILAAARNPEDSSSRAALAELCEWYWYPLYAFARRRGLQADDARDLTQSYFATLIEKGWLATVDRDIGRFRSFLLTSFKHFMSHERERERALKRGGPKPALSLDALDAEQRYRNEPACEQTPEAAFDRRWAHTVLDRVHGRLRAEFERMGKAEQYEALSEQLTSQGRQRPYKEIAAELGSTEAAVKMAVRRIRLRFGTLLRDEIGNTVGDPGEVEAEIKYLLEAIQNQ